MKYFFSALILLCCTLFMSCGQHTETSLPPRLFERAIEKDNGVLVDVRTPEEYAEEHLKGATLINFKDSAFAENVGKLDKEKPVYLYCHSGNRSAKARDLMISQGFKKVVHLEGGIEKWKSDGMPVEK